MYYLYTRRTSRLSIESRNLFRDGQNSIIGSFYDFYKFLYIVSRQKFHNLLIGFFYKFLHIVSKIISTIPQFDNWFNSQLL